MLNGFYEYFCDFTDMGSLTDRGLCNALPKRLQDTKAWSMIRPNDAELIELQEEGLPYAYWGAGSYAYYSRTLTPLRQNILLLAALLNGEEF